MGLLDIAQGAIANAGYLEGHSVHVELKISFLVMTHDPRRLVAGCNRVVELGDGRIERDERLSQSK